MYQQAKKVLNKLMENFDFKNDHYHNRKKLKLGNNVSKE